LFISTSQGSDKSHTSFQDLEGCFLPFDHLYQTHQKHWAKELQARCSVIDCMQQP
jgi:hypothetical protein